MTDKGASILREIFRHLSRSRANMNFQIVVALAYLLDIRPRGCTHQDYIRGSPSEKMEITQKVSNYFAYYPKVSSSSMERTQKYHRIVKRQKWFTEIPICTTIYNFASHQSPAKLGLNIHQLSSDKYVSKYLLIPHTWKSQCIKEILRKNSIKVWYILQSYIKNIFFKNAQWQG